MSRTARQVDEKQVLVWALGGIASFQALLAAGAPLGGMAWGGSHRGTLPPPLRIGSAVAATAWTTAAAAVATSTPASPRPQVLATIAGVAALGAPMNLASPSRSERVVWTPVSLGVAVLAWRLRARSTDPTPTGRGRRRG